MCNNNNNNNCCFSKAIVVTRALLCYVFTYIAVNASPISPLQPQGTSLSALFWSRVSLFYHQWAGGTHDTLPNCDLLLQFFEAVLCFRSSQLYRLLTNCIPIMVPVRGTRWRSWSRHCATSRKVAGSITDGVIGIFHWHNPSGRTMALGLTQPLTEMSTRNVSWGVKVAGA